MTHVAYEFVEEIPASLDEATLYISTRYRTVVHLCVCGCGYEAITPLAPGRWRLVFDGKTISLAPSIGNWSLPCQSHYWITRSHVQWDRRWSRSEIEAARIRDELDREHENHVDAKPADTLSAGSGWWSRFRGRFSSGRRRT